VREFNRRIVSGAKRFIFSPVKAEWIELVANKTRPYLSRIRW